VANILIQIKKSVKPGESVYYMDMNNKLDTKTITDQNNELEQFATNPTHWLAILEAVYAQQHSTNYSVTPAKNKKDEFTVSNTKDPKIPAFTVTIKLKNHALVIENLQNKQQTTIIETSKVMDSTSDTPTKDNQVERLIKNLKYYKNKSPKELKEYLDSIVKTL